MSQTNTTQPELTPEQAAHQDARAAHEEQWQAAAEAITTNNFAGLSKADRLVERTMAKIPGVGSDLIETPDGVMRREADKANADYNEKYKFGELALIGTIIHEDARKHSKLSIKTPEPDTHTHTQWHVPIVGRTLEQARNDALNKSRGSKHEQLSDTSWKVGSPTHIETNSGAMMNFDRFVAPALEKEDDAAVRPSADKTKV